MDPHPIVELTKRELNVQPNSLQERMVRAQVEHVQEDELLRNLALAIVAIGLGLLAAVPTGGGRLVAAGTAAAGAVGGAGLSAFLAYEHLREYELQAAATGTDFDKARAISNEDPSLFWLALDIVGAVVDVGGALRAFRSLRRTARAAMTAQAAGSASAPETLAALRRAGDEIQPGLGQRMVEDATQAAGRATRAGGAAAERCSVSTLDDVQRLRVSSPQRPAALGSADEGVWTDYLGYYYRRLDDIEAQLRSTRHITSNPPRMWESYREIRRGGAGAAQRGVAHQRRVTASVEDLEGIRVGENVDLGRVVRPARGEVRYTDQLLIEATETGPLNLTVGSNKSRDFTRRITEGLQSEYDVVREQVFDDVNELFRKYTGELYIRRHMTVEMPAPGGGTVTRDLYGQRVTIREAVLVYEERLIRPRALGDFIVSAGHQRAAMLNRRLQQPVDFHMAVQ